MAIYTKKFEEFENLTDASRENIFLIQHLKDKIQLTAFFSIWSFVIMPSTLYTDGLHTIIFKLAFILWLITIATLIYFIFTMFLLILEFKTTLQSLKNAEKAIDSHLQSLTHSRY